MALIPEDIIAQVIDRCDIVETIAAYVQLKKAGRNFKANCPFHNEKTPSFVVNPDKQIFHCFGCGVGGNVVTFVMKHDRLEFPEAIRLLASRVNVTIPEDESRPSTSNIRQALMKVNELAIGYFHKILLSDKSPAVKQAREYLKERDVALETVKKFQLGFAPDEWDGLLNYLKTKDISFGMMEKAGLIIPRENKEGYYDRFRNRVIFPIFDTMGHCRAFGARALEKDASAKYINSPETGIYVKGHHVYGFHLSKQAISQEDQAVIVEGYMDYLIPKQAGIENVVASLGTALTAEQVRLIRRYTKNVVMLFDSDPAGISAMIRSLDMLIEEEMNVRIANLTEGDDPDSFVRKYGAQALRKQLNEAKTLFDYKLDFLRRLYDVNSIEGKAKIASEMLPTIGKIGNEIIKTGYIQRLSEILLIPQAALVAELKKVRQMTFEKLNEEKQNKISVQEQVRNVEYDILMLLLEEESFISVTKNAVSLSDFQDRKIRAVIGKIYELFEQGKRVSPTSLLNCFEDEDIHNLISGLSAKDERVVGDKQKMHRDYVNRIKKDRLKNVRQQLLAEIQEAESTGDISRLDELKAKFTQIMKG